MSESIPIGPLDMARTVEREGRLYDAFTQQHLERHPEDEQNMAMLLGALNQNHPWHGQEITIDGIGLTVSLDDELAVPYSLPKNLERSSSRGLYHGLTVRRVYEPATDDEKFMVVHMVHTGDDPLELDPFGRIHETHNFDYFCLHAAQVAAALPINAHSFLDLEDDPVVAEVDPIVFDEEMGVLEKIVELGEAVNEVLAEEADDDYSEALNRQRASYINSFGLHSSIRLVVNDMLVGSRHESPPHFWASSLASTINFTPQLLDIAPGYDRSVEGVETVGGPPELYACVPAAEDKQMVMAPLKTILDVEEIPLGDSPYA